MNKNANKNSKNKNLKEAAQRPKNSETVLRTTDGTALMTSCTATTKTMSIAIMNSNNDTTKKKNTDMKTKHFTTKKIIMLRTKTAITSKMTAKKALTRNGTNVRNSRDATRAPERKPKTRDTPKMPRDDKKKTTREKPKTTRSEPKPRKWQQKQLCN